MPATGCIPPSHCKALASWYPRASALGRTAQATEVGFRPWGMLSCLWPDGVESNATPAMPLPSIPVGGLTP
jgi:hypothetical protein